LSVPQAVPIEARLIRGAGLFGAELRRRGAGNSPAAPLAWPGSREKKDQFRAIFLLGFARKRATHSMRRGKSAMKSKCTRAVVAVVLLGLGTSVALAQTADQHNAPGGPKDRVEKLTGGLPPPPPTPPSAPVSTTTTQSPPAPPPSSK
jgi:hypothetical protein